MPFKLYFSYIAVVIPPNHTFLEFLKPALHTIFFPSHWLLCNKTIVEKMDTSEQGINPVAMTITKPQKEYWPNPGIEPATSCSQVLYATPWAQRKQ